MHVIDEGHKYQLTDGQEIRFLKKVKNPDSGVFETVWVGTTNEELLEVLIDRTTNLNAKVASPENVVAIHLLKKALTVFNARTAARTLQNVEATPEAHQSAQSIIDEAAHILRTEQGRKMVMVTGDIPADKMGTLISEFQKGDLHPTASMIGLIGAHDGSAFPQHLTDEDRAAAMKYAIPGGFIDVPGPATVRTMVAEGVGCSALSEEIAMVPKAVWPFPNHADPDGEIARGRAIERDAESEGNQDDPASCI